MRRWWQAAVDAADVVSARPGLWLPGALAWTIVVGWLPFLVVVARPPSVADLTFLGARIYTSATWPWNAIVGGIGLLLVVACAFVVVNLAETILAVGGRRPPTARRLQRAIAIAVITATPALATLLAGGTAFVLVAMDEFNAPGAGDPLVRTMARLAPFTGIALVAWVGGAVVHAAAIRAVVADDVGVRRALATATERIARGGWPVLAAAVGTFVGRAAYAIVVGLLLHVLWSALAPRIATGRIGVEVIPLLVGFVGTWLCCVLGGGALQAWASLTWTLVLGMRPVARDGAGRRQGDAHRP